MSQDSRYQPAFDRVLNHSIPRPNCALIYSDKIIVAIKGSSDSFNSKSSFREAVLVALAVF